MPYDSYYSFHLQVAKSGNDAGVLLDHFAPDVHRSPVSGGSSRAEPADETLTRLYRRRTVAQEPIPRHRRALARHWIRMDRKSNIQFPVGGRDRTGDGGDETIKGMLNGILGVPLERHRSDRFDGVVQLHREADEGLQRAAVKVARAPAHLKATRRDTALAVAAVAAETESLWPRIRSNGYWHIYCCQLTDRVHCGRAGLGDLAFVGLLAFFLSCSGPSGSGSHGKRTMRTFLEENSSVSELSPMVETVFPAEEW